MSKLSQLHKYHRVFNIKIQPHDIEFRLIYFMLHRKTVSIDVLRIIVRSLDKEFRDHVPYMHSFIHGLIPHLTNISLTSNDPKLGRGEMRG